jgi:hypothetical protein
MHIPRLCCLIGLFALAGCMADTPPVATANLAPPATTAAATMPASTLQTPGDAMMLIDCHGVRLGLAEHANGDIQVSLERDGARRALETPPGMADYVPVGLGCTGQPGTPYVVVEYGERGGGCAVCEWFFLYDATGALLNRSAPPLRERDDGARAANNDAYAAQLSARGLQHPRITYPGP